MKNKSFSVLLVLVLLFPFMVNAKENCKVVSGDGKSLGSELACGTEHFYIIEANDSEVTMLAKYNLNTGTTIYREEYPTPEGDTRTRDEVCEEFAESKNPSSTIASDYSAYYDSFYASDKYCFYAKRIEYDKLVQNEEAKSAHWDEEGNYLYPQVGDVYIRKYLDTNQDNQDREPYPDTTNFFDLVKGVDMNTSTILNEYKDELNSMGFDIKEVNLLPLSKINDISILTLNKELPYQKWSDEASYSIADMHYPDKRLFAEYGSLKEYIPLEYKWLYSTTYWLGTVIADEMEPSGKYFVFMAEQGKICGAGSDYCASDTIIGCGVRPLVTMKIQYIEYEIKTETDGNGTIEVVNTSLGGEIIKFNVKSNNGYKLVSIVVKTENGEEVEFTEGEIIRNSDGTVSIDKNKFTMPFENVLIIGKWQKESNGIISDIAKNIVENPNTKDKFIIIITALLIALLTSIVILKNRKNLKGDF